MRRFTALLTLTITTTFFSCLAARCLAQSGDDVQRKREQIIHRGITYLSEQGQAEDGTFSASAGPGLTALAITAAIRCGEPIDSPMVAKGLRALEGFVKPDGGIYGSGRLKNYETCVSILCFAEANHDGRYDQRLADARRYVTSIQYGFADNRDPGDPWYGGVGYSSAGRPDLSNTSYYVEALRKMGAGPEDEGIQRALAFISRCQNLDTPGNDTRFAKLVGDGGFYYEIPLSKIDASTSERFTPNGGLRSYGSMTYAGLKSMIFAGLNEKDPRVAAALKWIRKFYSVEENPGMGSSGLYYYYHTFAASLAASGLDQVKDDAGAEHPWRRDLVLQLARQQNNDGSWSNQNRRWLEDDKNLATAFALMALSHCKPTTSD